MLLRGCLASEPLVKHHLVPRDLEALQMKAQELLWQINVSLKPLIIFTRATAASRYRLYYSTSKALDTKSQPNCNNLFTEYCLPTNQCRIWIFPSHLSSPILQSGLGTPDKQRNNGTDRQKGTSPTRNSQTDRQTDMDRPSISRRAEDLPHDFFRL